MQLTIFNGSPRRRKSNSKLLINKFLEGYAKENTSNVPVYYIASKKEVEKRKEAFKNAEIVILFLPLYVDSMPGIVKEFFEDIATLKDIKVKKIGFVIQSGYPESIHSVFLEKYLKKLSQRFGIEYIGTIIKGGVEGIQTMPNWMTNKLFVNFIGLGEYFAKHNEFDVKIKKKLAKPYKMSKLLLFIFNVLKRTELLNFYWNRNLRLNNAYAERYNHPYAK